MGTRAPVVEGVTPDIVIIGGGFTGLAAALACAEAGLSVQLFEAGKIGSGASGASGGQAIPGLRWGAADLLAEYGEDRARALVETALAARGHFWRLIERLGIDCEASRSGTLTVATNRSAMAHLAAEAKARRRLVAPWECTVLTRAEAGAEVASPVYHGGLLDPSGGHVDPAKLARGLATAAHRAGARIHQDTVVTRIDGTSVVTASGTTTFARHILVATDGAAGALLPELRPLLMNVGNFAIETEPVDPALIPNRRAVADTNFVLDYYRLTADNRLRFAGGERYWPGVPADIAGFVRPHMLRVFPQLGEAAIARSWSGQVAITRTRHAAIGRTGNVFHAAGYSGQGVILAPFVGHLIARAITGDGIMFDRLASLPAGRFPGGSALRTPLQVAGMLWFALRDRL